MLNIFVYIDSVNAHYVVSKIQSKIFIDFLSYNIKNYFWKSAPIVYKILRTCRMITMLESPVFYLYFIKILEKYPVID